MTRDRRSRSLLLLALPLLGSLALEAHAAGHAGRGREVFAQECSECHSVREGKNKKGPSLFAVVGRKAASVPDMAYSEAMKSSGITWTAEQLDAYLSAPKKLVPGGRMKYEGLADPAARADLLAYLATLH